jgi:hypothetical protein
MSKLFLRCIPDLTRFTPVPALLDMILCGDVLDITANRKARAQMALEHYRWPQGSARYLPLPLSLGFSQVVKCIA